MGSENCNFWLLSVHKSSLQVFGVIKVSKPAYVIYEWSLLWKLALLTFRSDFTSLIPNQGSRQDCHICVNVLIIGGASLFQSDKYNISPSNWLLSSIFLRDGLEWGEGVKICQAQVLPLTRALPGDPIELTMTKVDARTLAMALTFSLTMQKSSQT